MVNHPNRKKQRIYVTTTDRFGRWYYNDHYGNFCESKWEATAYSSLYEAEDTVKRIKRRSGTEATVVVA